MPGARMIFNARYFHIAKSGESLSKHALHKDAAAGLVNYIATRESVVHNFTPAYELADVTDLQRAKIEEFLAEESEVRNLKEFEVYKGDPTAANATRLLSRASGVIAGVDTGEERPAEGTGATTKQQERIQEFLSAVPELKESMEYNDFLQDPTFENASEFLSNALDNSLGAVVEPETLRIMVNYMATRPGVVKDSEHGLFSGDDVTDLEAYKKEVSEHTGNVYSTVVSLRREDADALGFDTQEPWKDTVRAKLDVVASSAGIPINDLRWCAAMHNTGHHPHIHLMFWSQHPSSQNYLSEKGIAKIRSSFAHEIFRGEFEQIYEQQKNLTHDLKNESSSLLQNLTEHISQYAGDPDLIRQFSALSQDLSELQGKHQYKYLPKRMKEQVNGIIDQMEAIPEIRRLHELYEESNNQMLSIYKSEDKLPIRKLSEAKSGENLYFLKNLVLQTAESFPADLLPSAESISEEAPASDCNAESRELIDRLETLSADGDKTAAKLLGDIFAEGLPGIASDPDAAITWYGIAANPYEPDALPMAAYRLTSLLDSKELAGEFAFQAAAGFMRELGDSPNAQLIQDLYAGKYRYDERESYAKEQYAILKELLPDAAYEPPAVYRDSPENAERLFYLGQLFAKGYSFRPDDAPDAVAGIEQDSEKAESFLQLAADMGYAPENHEHILQEAEPEHVPWPQHGQTEKDVQKAEPREKEPFPYYKKLNDHAWAQYKTAEALLHGTGTVQNPEAAQIYYAKALQGFIKQNAGHPDASLQYRIAGMMERGYGCDASPSSAFSYYKQAADDGHAQAAYKVGNAYHNGNGVPINEAFAQRYYGKALDGFFKQEAQKPDAYTEYKIGRMYEKGFGTDKNPETAKAWYQKAADGGSEPAQQALDRMDNSRQPAASPAVSSLLESLLRTAAAQLHEETVRQQNRQQQMDRKEHRRVLEKKHEMGMKEDWEQEMS